EGAATAGRPVFPKDRATTARLPADVLEDCDRYQLASGFLRTPGVRRGDVVARPAAGNFVGAVDGSLGIQRPARRRTPGLRRSRMDQQADGDVSGSVGRQFVCLGSEAQLDPS